MQSTQSSVYHFGNLQCSGQSEFAALKVMKQREKHRPAFSFRLEPLFFRDFFCVVRSLMVMLDSLLTGAHRDAYLCTTLAQGWLLQAIDRGDLIRILEPLLIMLLHPDSARFATA